MENRKIAKKIKLLLQKIGFECTDDIKSTVIYFEKLSYQLYDYKIHISDDVISYVVLEKKFNHNEVKSLVLLNTNDAENMYNFLLKEFKEILRKQKIRKLFNK